MATRHEFQVVEGIAASADLSAKQYYFVELSTGQIAVCNAEGDSAVGVLADKPEAAGRIGQVVRLGGVMVVAGAAVSVGDKIKCDSSGRAITVDPTGAGGDAGHAVLGEARSAATAAGQVISALINCINPPVAANTYT